MSGRKEEEEAGGGGSSIWYDFLGTENLETLEKKARSEGLPDLESFASLKAEVIPPPSNNTRTS